jgi:hypothetical protein
VNFQWFLFRVRELGVWQTVKSALRKRLRGTLPWIPRSSTLGTMAVPGTDLTVTYRNDSMDRIVFHQIFIAEEYAIPPSIVNKIGTPDVIFDLGANVGYATTWSAPLS